jgi:hypothetical protein
VIVEEQMKRIEEYMKATIEAALNHKKEVFDKKLKALKFDKLSNTSRQFSPQFDYIPCKSNFGLA